MFLAVRISLVFIALISSNELVAQAPPPAPAPVASTSAPQVSVSLSSGINIRNMDTNVRPQDDFYRYTNGTWLEKTAVPPDKSRWGSFDELRETALESLHGIVEDLVGQKGKVYGSEAQKIGDLFESFMDESRREALGLKPLQSDLATIDALSDKAGLPALIGTFHQTRVTAPFAMRVAQDAKDATKYAVILTQSGLGLPDRDYYLNETDAKFKDARIKYVALIEKKLAQAGEKDSGARATEILALETQLARAQWSRVENRNPVKTYNKVELDKMAELAPGFDWKMYLRSTELTGKVTSVIVSQPTFMSGFSRAIEGASLVTWRAYFKWHLINHYSPYLDKTFVDDNFAFTGSLLRGVPANEEAWKRGVRLVESSLGEALGKRYVERYLAGKQGAHGKTCRQSGGSIRAKY